MEQRERRLITAGTASHNVLLLLPCSAGDSAPHSSRNPSPRALPRTPLATPLPPVLTELGDSSSFCTKNIKTKQLQNGTKQLHTTPGEKSTAVFNEHGSN